MGCLLIKNGENWPRCSGAALHTCSLMPGSARWLPIESWKRYYNCRSQQISMSTGCLIHIEPRMKKEREFSRIFDIGHWTFEYPMSNIEYPATFTFLYENSVAVVYFIYCTASSAIGKEFIEDIWGYWYFYIAAESISHSSSVLTLSLIVTSYWACTFHLGSSRTTLSTFLVHATLLMPAFRTRKIVVYEEKVMVIVKLPSIAPLNLTLSLSLPAT